MGTSNEGASNGGLVNSTVQSHEYPGIEVAVIAAKGVHHMNNSGKRLSGALLTLAFVFGISALTVTTAQAQYRNAQYQRRDSDSRSREWGNRRRDSRWDNQRAQEWRWRRNRDWDRFDRNRRYNDSYRNRSYGNY